MASYCRSLVFMGFCLLSFSCGGARGKVLIEKELDYSTNVAPMLYPNFTAEFSKAKDSEIFSKIASIKCTEDHERDLNAVALVQDSGPFVGGSGDIVVWNPHVESKDTSINFVACVADNISIYAGYGVFPAYSGDTKSRIFLYTSVEGECCLNDAKCMGFVQVDSTYQPGGILEVSDYNDPAKRQVLQVLIAKDEGKWWVTLNKVRIGYFDSDVMKLMECRAILWGGGVSWAGQKPTATQMGNGHFPKNEDHMHCGAISRAFAINKDGITNEDPHLYIVDNPNCYDFVKTSASEFKYGGSGSLSSGCT